MWGRKRSERRKNDWKKAIRKHRIITHYPGFEDGWYSDLHRYSKGKIHCSCPLCASKTNMRGFLSCGPNMNWSRMDRRRLDEMDYELNEEE